MTNKNNNVYASQWKFNIQESYLKCINDTIDNSECISWNFVTVCEYLMGKVLKWSVCDLM